MAANLGNWQQALDKLLETAKASGKFVSQELFSDEHTLFMHICKEEYVSKVPWLDTYFSHCQQMHRKDTVKSADLRNQGNSLFQQKKYREALDLYSKAILFAPTASEELPLAYGNRSAVLFYLQQFQSCLEDVGWAIDTGYPEKSLPKLLTRRNRCYLQMKNELDIGQAKDLKTQADVCKNISHLSLSKDKGTPYEESECNIPVVSYGPNKVITQASSAVDMKNNHIQGRFLTANHEIMAGDTLIVERPFAAVLLPDHYDTHCHHCFGQLASFIPCNECTVVQYCSRKCRDESFHQYHSIECSYLDLLHSVGIAHLSLRVILVAGLNFLLEFRKSVKERGGSGTRSEIPGVSKDGTYSRTYLSVYDLMTHLDDMTPDDAFQYGLTARLLLKILEHSGWFTSITYAKEVKSSGSDKLKSETGSMSLSDSTSDYTTDLPDNKISKPAFDDFDSKSDLTEGSLGSSNATCDKNNSLTEDTSRSRNSSCDKMSGSTSVNCDKESDCMTASSELDAMYYIGSLLLRHILQLICNAHAITELQVSQVADSQVVESKSQVRVATAIYPTASLMNHSCDPTIISSFHKDTLVVRAVKDVPCGGEIFNCYGPHYKRMCHQERQQVLKDQYFFTCTCLPCAASQHEQAAFFALKCPACEGALVLSGVSEECRSECRSCGLSKTCTEELKMVDKGSMLFNQGLDLLNQDKVNDALQSLIQCYKVRTTVLHKHNKDLSEVQDCLARCYAVKGKFKKAAKLLRLSTRTVEVVYGDKSIELANELQKFAEVLVSAGEFSEAATVTERAIELFTVHYGEPHDTVKELKSMRTQLLEVITLSPS